MQASIHDFVKNLHPSATLLSTGTASVLGHHVDAVLVRNLYGQELVWGYFGCKRGKFNGSLSQNATTEDVTYEATNCQ